MCKPLGLTVDLRCSRSPSTSPQDRFNNARLKFVQMEQEKEATPPPVVTPKKPSSPGTGELNSEPSRNCVV